MKNTAERRDLDFYLNLHYPVTIHADPEGGYVVEIEELPGCMTQAETLDEALKAIEDARKLWIKTAYEGGQEIPLPREMEEYTGKFLVRIPKSLHRALVRAAKREGVSLNQYVTNLLSAGVQGDFLKLLWGGFAPGKQTMIPHIGVTVFGSTGMVRSQEDLGSMRRVRLVGKE